MRPIRFTSAANETVRGVLFEPSTPRPPPAIIFAHGFLSTHEEFGDYPEKFCQRGYLALAIDFRGHGASDGRRGLISEERMVEDLKCALDFIETHPAVDKNHIALFGHSLGGGGVVCAAARDARVRAIVAGATVGSLRDELGTVEYTMYRLVDTVNKIQKVVTRKSLYIPYRVSYKDIFADADARQRAETKNFLQRTTPADNVPLLLRQNAMACARKVHVPALILWSELDRIVKYSSTRAVYDALAGEKEFYVIRGSGHSFATDCKGAEAFEHIAAWLDKYLKTRP